MRGSFVGFAGLVICAIGGCVSTSRVEYPGTNTPQASAPAQMGQLAPSKGAPGVVEVTGVVKAGFSFFVNTVGSRASVVFTADKVPPVSVQMEAIKEVTGCDAFPYPPGQISTSAPDQNGVRLSSAVYVLLCSRGAGG